MKRARHGASILGRVRELRALGALAALLFVGCSSASDPSGPPGNDDVGAGLNEPCGSGCGTGLSCHEGICVCSSGLPACDGKCVNTEGDPANCGACGNACAEGQGCFSGSCSTSSSALVVAFVAPTDGASFDSTINEVVVKAEDADGVESVELFLEGISLGVRKPGKLSWKASEVEALVDLAPGTYRLEARAKDTTGEEATVSIDVLVTRGKSNLVEIEVSGVDDRLTLWVNDIPRRTWTFGGPGQNVRKDVSAWFGSGTNRIRLQHENDAGGAGFLFRVYVDDELEWEASPNGGNGFSIESDQTHSFELENLPALRTVELDGPEGGALYVNDTFLGKTTPTTLELPQGSLVFGLGVGDFKGNNRYDGAYFEREVKVVADETFDLEEGEHPEPNVWKVALLPIKTTHHGSSSADDTGILLDADVTKMASQLVATSKFAIAPLSYGLMQWTVTTLPMTDVPLERPADPGQWPRTGDLLEDANLKYLEDDYDLVVYLYSEHKENGMPVASRSCCGWGGGKGISIPTGWVRGEPAEEPNEGYVHEALHSYESYQGWMLYRLPVTIGGLHGGGAQGYHSGDCGEQHYMCWYKRFIRGQVGIDLSMDGAEKAQASLSPNLYGGVFYTMRRGAKGKVGGPLAE